MFVGVILIHRMITYVPTYSEFKYETLSLTNVLLAFMILVLSIQTKLGIKVGEKGPHQKLSFLKGAGCCTGRNGAAQAPAL